MTAATFARTKTLTAVTDKTYRGVPSLLPDHANWRDAFQAVFSMNVQDLYSSLGSGPYPSTGATDDWYEGPAIDVGAVLPGKSLTLNAIFATP